MVEKPLMDSEEENRKRMQQVASFATLPFVLGIPPIVGFFLGDWLDHYFETKPYLMYLFLVLGFIAGIRESYRIVKRFKE